VRPCVIIYGTGPFSHHMRIRRVRVRVRVTHEPYLSAFEINDLYMRRYINTSVFTDVCSSGEQLSMLYV